MMEVAGELKLKRLLHTAKRRVGKCCPKKLKLKLLGMRSALLNDLSMKYFTFTCGL